MHGADARVPTGMEVAFISLSVLGIVAYHAPVAGLFIGLAGVYVGGLFIGLADVTSASCS